MKMDVIDFRCKYIKRNENIILGKSIFILLNKYVIKIF